LSFSERIWAKAWWKVAWVWALGKSNRSMGRVVSQLGREAAEVVIRPGASGEGDADWEVLGRGLRPRVFAGTLMLGGLFWLWL
jgi:hypothetical protein